jgi:hypothetical protein
MLSSGRHPRDGVVRLKEHFRSIAASVSQGSLTRSVARDYRHRASTLDSAEPRGLHRGVVEPSVLHWEVQGEVQGEKQISRSCEWVQGRAIAP